MAAAKHLIFSTLIAVMLLTAGASSPVYSQEIIRTPDEILAASEGAPTADAIRELFINCSEWDEEHEAVKDSSREALIGLGSIVVPTLLEGWISSVDIRRRIELDNVIKGIGHPAAQYLIPYLTNDDWNTRRHAAYLIGDTAAISAVGNPLSMGPLPNDQPGIDALRQALSTEQNWHVKTQILQALGAMRDASQITLIASYLNDEEQSVRLSAVIGLGRIPDQRAVPGIIGAFSDRVATVRQAAVLALSTVTLGNLAFEALNGAAILSPTGQTARLCALDALARYFESVGGDRSTRINEQRARAFSTAKSIIENVATPASWTLRGYSVVVIGYTYQPNALDFLSLLRAKEENQFVIGKIDEAADRIRKGLPETVGQEG